MINHIISITKKDYLELKKNNYLFLTACLPIIFSIIIYFNNSKDLSSVELFLTLSGTYVFSIILVIASTIAEEKEYNTLEALIMSPISFLEIIIGKSIIPFIIGVFNYGMGCYFLLNLNLHNNFNNLLIFILMICFSIELGTLIGVASKNISQVNILFIPLFIYMTAPIFYKYIIEYNNFFKMVKFFPTAQQYALYINDTKFLIATFIILIWSFIVAMLMYYFYKKIIIND